MILSLCQVTAGGGLDWPSFVALAGRTGYDGVDVPLGAVRDAGSSATSDLLAKHDVRPAICDLPTEFRADDAAFDGGMKELPEFARLAGEIGCPRMATWVPPTFDRPGSEMRDVLRRRFTEIATVLADHGVRLGLEFISPEHIRTSGQVCIWQMADMLELCCRCGDNVGLLLDCWHWHHDPDHSTDAIVGAGKDRIVTVHLNDSADLPPADIRDNQRLLPGEGVIDLKGFLGALRQVGYEDAVTVEVFGRLDKLSDDEAATAALEASHAVMAQV
jgi:sugar phosphate isomerase/epimerase